MFEIYPLGVLARLYELLQKEISRSRKIHDFLEHGLLRSLICFTGACKLRTDCKVSFKILSLEIPGSDMNTSRFLRMEGWWSEISESKPDPSTGLYKEALKSVFHLSSQICRSFIEALCQIGLTNQSKQYQLLRFCWNKNLTSHKYVSIFT